MNELSAWQPQEVVLPSGLDDVHQIATRAVQLSKNDKLQITKAFEAGFYPMALNYLWGKTILALKRELGTVGVELLAEMLGKPDIEEDDDVEDIVTDREAIRLAEELGVVTSTDALRLRHAYELITHFVKRDLEHEHEQEQEINRHEAIGSLETCVRSVLGRPKIEVASKFVKFRNALERNTIAADDEMIDSLTTSPYFFLKLTINVLVNATRRNEGASLEHILANVNTIIPAIWPQLREVERWQVGRAYAEAYVAGRATAVAGLKRALLKVKGFDFVPENLRSDTFVKAANAILAAHDGMDNFYKEVAPVQSLGKLGTTIPTLALPACMTALLSVVLGNRYGHSWSAQPHAMAILKTLTDERWSYYLNYVLPSDLRILAKLQSEKPVSNWIDIVKKYDLVSLSIKDKNIKKLISSATAGNYSAILKTSEKIEKDFYNKSAK